ncbi:hypothetical protein [Marinobacter zhejiangensis]|uniref:Calcineurin-like phosphoesterase superfamily domain-containing protein n=1 Tax=Marinobacter zhejiangensis TaxID=488535 RepID=A0A1I4M056_9GAMM|nr:hypothetical protein [Marinobacter zhejiangensis]SFL96357.1 hypothetical protein SAMN04487963_0761 [Marinobacter zhejiangensis]
MAEQPGRSCPLAYRYRPEQLGEEPEDWSEDVLYVAGGLYGNPFALDAIEAMVAAERAQGRRVRLLFNGDFNWFNAREDLFHDINRRVLRHDAMLGNVEYELANPSEAAGCGCGYPDFVKQGVVERSNRMMVRLQQQAKGAPDVGQQLAGLKRWRTGIFGGLKVLIVHGDVESLAGWGLSREAFEAGNQEALTTWFDQTGVDVILCSHTCLPLLWSGELKGRRCLVANNGSAGMASVAGDSSGMVTRLSFKTAGCTGFARAVVGAVEVSLVPVSFDLEAWLGVFDQLWPAGSDAAVSYRHRMIHGTSLAAEMIHL